MMQLGGREGRQNDLMQNEDQSTHWVEANILHEMILLQYFCSRSDGE